MGSSPSSRINMWNPSVYLVKYSKIAIVHLNLAMILQSWGETLKGKQEQNRDCSLGQNN